MVGTSNISDLIEYHGLKIPYFREMVICPTEGVYMPKLDSLLLLRELAKYVKPNNKVLDIGTGSGILAILSVMRGANALGIDIHKNSILNARINASLNHVDANFLIGDLFKPLKQVNYFNIIVGNVPSLPSPSDNNQNEYAFRTTNAGRDGRRFIDQLINQAPKYLKEGGSILLLHSNFSNISITLNKLENLGFLVDLTVEEYPIGKTSSQYIYYFMENLSECCWPVQKENKWYQKIAIFRAKLCVDSHV